MWVLEWSASLRIVALKHNYFIENTPHWTDKGAKDIVSRMLLCNALWNLPNFNPCSCHLVVVFLLLPAILKYRYRTLSEATKTALKNINKSHSQREKKESWTLKSVCNVHSTWKIDIFVFLCHCFKKPLNFISKLQFHNHIFPRMSLLKKEFHSYVMWYGMQCVLFDLPKHFKCFFSKKKPVQWSNELRENRSIKPFKIWIFDSIIFRLAFSVYLLVLIIICYLIYTIKYFESHKNQL